MSEEKPRTAVDRMKDYIPFFTTMLMIAGISFTYYTYFYDIKNTPQIILDQTITKIDETENFYILKINLTIKNQSKSKVEIVANQCRLYASRCKLLDVKSDILNDDKFKERILDRADSVNRKFAINSLYMNRYLECGDNHFLGFYQPIHNDSWLLPEETMRTEITSAVPKIFDMVDFEIWMTYALKEDNIIVKYEKDKAGEISYKLYVMESKDSSKTHELSYFDERDEGIIKKNEIIFSGYKIDYWLSGNNAVKNSIKNTDLSKAPADTSIEEK